MKRYLTLVALLLLLFLSMFFVIEQRKPSLLTDPYQIMNDHSVSVALTGIGLLMADVILPVPSSLVMVANGTLFGVALGTVLSLIGSLGAACVGFAMGRCSKSWMARYLLSSDERTQAQHLLERWGLLAIILTRPVPLFAETTTIMAGASKMQWRAMCLAALAGSLPFAVLYAVVGTAAGSWDNLMLSFGGVLLIAGVFWGLGRYLHVHTQTPGVDQLGIENLPAIQQRMEKYF